jgi:peptidyl-prolyl cis-trans isomerase C
MRALALILLLVGCSPTPPPAPTQSAACGDGRDGSEVLARLQDVQVSRRDLDAAVARLPARARARYARPDALAQLAERVLEERLLCRAALAEGLDVSAVAARAQEDAIAAWYVDRTEASAVTDEAVAAWFDAHSDRYRLEVVDVDHIVVETEERAQALLRELRAGADFANLAMEHSLDSRTAPAGGRVGWIARGRREAAWTDAAFALQPGGISDPVQTSFGWVLLRVNGRKDTQPLEEVRPGIERKLRQRASAALLERVRTGDPEFLGPLEAGAAGPQDPTP